MVPGTRASSRRSVLASCLVCTVVTLSYPSMSLFPAFPFNSPDASVSHHGSLPPPSPPCDCEVLAEPGRAKTVESPWLRALAAVGRAAALLTSAVQGPTLIQGPAQRLQLTPGGKQAWGKGRRLLPATVLTFSGFSHPALLFPAQLPPLPSTQRIPKNHSRFC